jgi:hypothetical protein
MRMTDNGLGSFPFNDHPVDQDENRQPALLAGMGAAHAHLTGEPKEDHYALPTP